MVRYGGRSTEEKALGTQPLGRALLYAVGYAWVLHTPLGKENQHEFFFSSSTSNR